MKIPALLLAGPAVFSLSALRGAIVDRAPYGLGPAEAVATTSAASSALYFTGDANGDGLDDLFSTERPANGEVKLYLNTGSGFENPATVANVAIFPGELPLTGDFNGDGRDDIAVFTRSTTGDVFVYLAQANGTFAPHSKWHDYFCLGDEIPLVGDFNGNGLDDIATCTRGASADVYVATSSGSSFNGTGLLWHSDFCPGNAIPAAGDVDGDGMADLIAFIRSSQTGTAEGDVIVARSDGLQFLTAQKFHDFFCLGNEPPLVGDLSGDGTADLLTFAPDYQVYGALSARTSFEGTGWRWHPDMKFQPAPTGDCRYLAGHFNGDVNLDVLRIEPGAVTYVVRSLCGQVEAPKTPSPYEREAWFGAGTLGVDTSGGPFIHPPMNVRPAQETTPLVVFLVAAPPDTAAGRTTFAHPASYYDAMIFGPEHPNVNHWFREMSGSRFAYTRSGVVGPVYIPAPTAPGFGHFTAALAQFDFRAAGLDPDGNNIVENNEAAILIFDNLSEGGGTTVFVDLTAPQPNGKPAIRVRLKYALAGHRSAIQNPAHELVHALGVGWDVYNTSCYGTGYNVMSCTGGADIPAQLTHLDPWHKMRLGWFTPRVSDVSKFPGMAFIDPPQYSGGFAYRPPVLLYDSRRGTHEMFMLDYRDATAPSGAGSSSSYDRDVPAPGLKPWYVRTKANHDLDQIPNAIILRGNDGFLNTTLNPSTDDVYSTDLTAIWPGRNGVVDTLPHASDSLVWNNCLFPTFHAWSYGSRDGAGELLNGVATQTTVPEWVNGDSSGVNLAVERNVAGPGAIVHWGPTFTPWIETTFAVQVASSVTSVYGLLGARTPGPGTPRVEYTRIGGPATPTTYTGFTYWDGLAAGIRTPHRLPGGTYLFRLSYQGSSALLSSNAWRISVRNIYQDWLNTLFAPDRVAAWDEVRPDQDPDQDGFSNALEFQAGTDPRNSGSIPPITVSMHPDGLHLVWSAVRSQHGLYTIDAEWSTNLISWTRVTDVRESYPSPEVQRWTAVQAAPAGAKRLFLRLRTMDLSGS